MLLILGFVSVSGVGSSKDGGQARSELTEIDSRMFGTEDVTFLTGNNSVLLAHQGSTVTLSCRLTKTPNFGMVTWSRRLSLDDDSLQILSIGDQVHINDQRFLIAKTQQDNDWELQIISVKNYDSGQYQCQATSHPPSFISTTLHVVDAFAEIQVEDKTAKKSELVTSMVKEEEARLKFIQVGSQLKLNCYLRKATEPPAYIFWFHNKTMVNYSPELGRQVINHQDGMGSTLMIMSVEAEDAGNYTCAPPNIHPHSVIINIMDSEGKYAAVSRDGNSSVQTEYSPLLLLIIYYFLNQV